MSAADLKDLKKAMKHAKTSWKADESNKDLKRLYKDARAKYREAKTGTKDILKSATSSDSEPLGKKRSLEEVARNDVGEQDDAAEADAKKKGHTGKRKRRRKRKSKTTPEDAAVDVAEDSVDNLDDALVDTIYVEGIPYETSDDDMRSLFLKCGQILSLRMPRWHDSGRARGYAHIQFENGNTGVSAALAMDGHRIGGRFLKIARARPAGAKQRQANAHKDHPKGCRTLFVKNLPYEVNENDVSSAFAKFGEVSNVRLAYWNHTKNLKGFGYVEFSKPDGAKAAFGAPGGITVKGRILFIDYETSARPKGSFRELDGRSWKFSGRGRGGRGRGRGSRGRGRGGRGRGRGMRR